MAPSDTALIERARSGSADAFCSLAERHRDALFRFLWFRCGNRADAEDAVQEALINAWRYLDSYDSRWQFTTWLYRIALRALPKPQPPGEAVDNLVDPDDDVLKVLERENLWRTALNILPREALLAMWLHYGEGVNHKEIAKTLSRSVSWVKVNLMRSRNRLAEVMTEQTG